MKSGIYILVMNSGDGVSISSYAELIICKLKEKGEISGPGQNMLSSPQAPHHVQEQ